ncbi:MAG: hypothetical protein JST54_19725 [Deltaproteobacteria bacterium]|nr:hypothetical protein [Deltaproteobacteria bacterium]
MRKRRPILAAAVLALALGALACHKEQPDAFGQLSPDEVQKMVEAKQVSVFDNNSQDRFNKSHVPTATWLQFDEVKPTDLPADKDRNLVFYCANEH